MAEFALGLTKTAVEGTVSRVKSAIEEEAELRVRVQDDLVFITGEFEMMQSFLSAANAGERASKNLVVRTWVRQIRDLAFDVEDCVEFIVHLDMASPWDWVWRLVSPVMVCTAKPPLPLDLAVAEIKRLKVRMEDISQRNTRYNLLIGHNDSPADAHHPPHLPVRPSRARGTSAPAAAAATFHALREVWESRGKLYKTSDLKRLIHCNGSKLQVISLWASPKVEDCEDVAVGDPGWATTSVKKAYYDPEICREFSNRAWVRRLTHPFSPVEFLNNLLTQFRSHHRDFDHDDGDHADLRLSKLVKQLSEQRYLIVIEQELTTVADWDAIRMYLPDGNNGSRIVVSTNHLGLALTCTGSPYQVCELKRFSQDQCLYAFFPEGCGHRIGMGELIWQSRYSSVISVFAESYHDMSEFRKGLHGADVKAAIDNLKFEGCLWPRITRDRYDKLDLVEIARNLIFGFYPEDEEDSVDEELEGLSDEDIIERCRKLLTEHSYLIFIFSLVSTEDWDLMKQQLLPEPPTRSRIVVIAKRADVAKHCVDHDEYRTLNARDLLKGSNTHGGGNIKEKVECELVGRENCLEELFLYGANPGWTMSVWGIAAVGKTAVAREMYKTSRYRYGMQGWVDAPYPFNLTELCQQLLLDFYSDDVDAKESAAVAMMEGQDPIQWCCEILRQTICLLVIDGLRSTHDWDMVKATLLSQPNEGNTLVITREESIAMHCTQGKKGTFCSIQGLEDDAALDLFSKIALEGEKLSEIAPEKQKISKLLVSKCGGFPEVIIAIAERARACSLDIEKLKEINFNFMGILETRSTELSSLKGLFSWMKSYFDACSDELKPCIFYLSVFPPDKTVRWRRLLRRWIAEGYSRDMSIGGTWVEKGEKFLGNLMRDGILYQDHEIASTARGSSKLNGFFHEYISSRPMEDNHVFALEGRSSPHSRLTGQHLTIRESWERDNYAFNLMDLSRLRSLTVFGVWKSFFISDKMKVLRVLDLEGTSTSLGTNLTDNDLEEIVKLFSRLKFLSIRGCIHITRLPDTLGDMRQLQTLDVKYTSIIELPSTITKLHKLQYIRAGTTTDTSPLLVQAAAAPPPPSPQEDGHGDTSPFLRGAVTESVVSTRITPAWKTKARYLVKSSWQNLRNHQRVAANGGGVEVFGAAAKGIGSLIHLHTLGVVNVAGRKRGGIFLKELKKLTQLRKLRLSGINRENWRSLCDAISGNLHHLESLSLQLMLLEKDSGSYEFACFDDICEPPRTIKRLKVLYTTEGQVASIRAAWISKLPNLESFNHDLTISTQEDTGLIPKAVQWDLCIKPTVGHLSFEKNVNLQLKSLRVECSGNTKNPHSKVTFGSLFVVTVGALSIHCCSSSSSSSSLAGTSTAALSSCGLQIAGLRQIMLLKKVVVTGPCGVNLQRDLRAQLEEHDDEPDLELAS